MDILKSTIKEVESKIHQIDRLTRVTGHNDYVIESNGRYQTYTFTPAQVKRVDLLLAEFKREMIEEIEPTKQKLATLEQLLG